MNKKTLGKAIQMRKTNALSDNMVDGPGMIEVSSLAFITKCFDDEITLGNLDSNEIPEMVKYQFDLPIFNNKEIYNCEDHVKLRILAKNDWGRVNWDNMSLKDPNAEPVHVEAVILNIHGGSWNSGSSGDRYPFSKNYAIKTGFPVFSIDYRLAPAHKFPAGLNDCFQMYVWLRYYASKYLQLSFDRIILEGDSAGGNLSLSVSSLSIMRGIQGPDRLVVHYPCASVTPYTFAPALVGCADDNQLGHHYLPNIIIQYCDAKFQNHMLATPKFLTQDILAKFPDCYFQIPESDPVRDDVLRLTLKLKKAGAKVEARIFKHTQHGFMGHSFLAHQVKMGDIATESAINSMLA